MVALILDSGALIASERDERRFWVAFKQVQEDQGEVVVPAPVLAQVWRDRRQVKLARLVNACELAPLDGPRARLAGELCAATSTADIVDAAVAVLAFELVADVATSDPVDIRRLMNAAGAAGRILPM
jgi:hypothetical protein